MRASPSRSSTSTLGFDSSWGPEGGAGGGGIGLRTSMQSSSLHACFGLRRAFGLLRVLRAPMRASAGTIIIGWLGRRRNRGQAPALAAGARLNRAWTSVIPQPPCPGCPCNSLAYSGCSYSNAVLCKPRVLQPGIRPARWSSIESKSRVFGSIRPLLPIFTSFHIIITCYYSNNVICYYKSHIYYYVVIMYTCHYINIGRHYLLLQ